MPGKWDDLCSMEHEYHSGSLWCKAFDDEESCETNRTQLKYVKINSMTLIIPEGDAVDGFSFSASQKGLHAGMQPEGLRSAPVKSSTSLGRSVPGGANCVFHRKLPSCCT